MAGYTTNPGLADALAGLGKQLFPSPLPGMKAAMYRAQANKYNHERLRSIEEERRAAEAAKGLTDLSGDLGRVMSLTPSPPLGPSGLDPRNSDRIPLTRNMINQNLSEILGQGTQYKDFSKNAFQALRAQTAAGFADPRQRMSAFNNASGSNLNTLLQDAGIAEAEATATESLAGVTAGLKPIPPDMYIPPPLAEVIGADAQGDLNEWSDTVSARDAAEDIAKAKAAGNPPKAYNYITLEGAQGLTIDGVFDLNDGSKLPQGTQVVTKGVEASTVAGLGIGTPTQRGARAEQKAQLLAFSHSILQAKNLIASNPNVVGFRGFLQRFVQNTVDVFSGSVDPDLFATQMREAIDTKYINNELVPDVIRNSLKDSFDEGAASIVSRFNLLAYQAAAAVAAQTGRALSDADFDRFLEVLGDPTSWTTGPRAVIAKLKLLEIAVANQVAYINALGSAPLRPFEPEGSNSPTDPVAPKPLSPEMEALVKQYTSPEVE